MPSPLQLYPPAHFLGHAPYPPSLLHCTSPILLPPPSLPVSFYVFATRCPLQSYALPKPFAILNQAMLLPGGVGVCGEGSLHYRPTRSLCHVRCYEGCRWLVGGSSAGRYLPTRCYAMSVTEIAY
eukprot:1537948-Rhodomonas_salina.2